MKRAIVPLLLLLALIPIVHGATANVSVAKDWRIPYLLGYYSSLKGVGFLAADSRATATEVFPYLLHKNDNITIYEDDDPFVKNYASVLEGFGFTHLNTVHIKDPYALNFDLINKYGPFNCYVIVPDSSGEWLYAAGSYAYAKGCAIVLLNNRSIDRIISNIPSSADVTIIGYQGKRLKKAFPNATFISTGSKAGDAVKLAQNYPNAYDQVFIVSGMYLYLPGNLFDPPIWTGAGGRYPVLIAYPTGMPDITHNFLLNNNRVKSVVFIGPELDPVFGKFRDEVNGQKIVRELINVGYQGVPTRVPGQAYPLPVLLLPSGDIKITAENVSALPQGKLFITFRNLGDAAGYVRITYVELNCNGLKLTPDVPDRAFLVMGKDSTVVELNAGDAIPDSGCVAHIEARYGPDADRLLFSFTKNIGFKPEKINDPTKLEVERVMYSPRLDSIVIFVKNDSDVKAYATPMVLNVLVDGVPTNFKGRTRVIPPNGSGKLYVRATLTPADLVDNSEVKVLIRYGKYRNLPIKTLSGTYNLEKETLTDVIVEFMQENPLLTGVGLLIILILLVLILRRR